jgi:molybdopterin-guanine dinucleotide biosynthesis protein A
MPDHSAIPGLLLAGGLAQRMGGGDKPMKSVGGRPILSRVIARLAPQCDGLLLNANGDPSRFAAFGLPVIADTVEGFAGPLAGILTGLEWVAANRPDAVWMLSAAADCPFLPHDLVGRLHAAGAAAQTPVAIAASGERSHPVIGLWSVDLRHDLRRALLEENIRTVGRWTARYDPAVVIWPAEPFDPFFNTNTPEDLARAEEIAAHEET